MQTLPILNNMQKYKKIFILKKVFFPIPSPLPSSPLIKASLPQPQRAFFSITNHSSAMDEH